MKLLIYFRKGYLILKFILFLTWEIIVANIRIAYDIVTPRLRARPGVIAVPLDCKTDLEITLLANVISLTPGTLTLDVSADRKSLYLHAMYIDDVIQLKKELKRKFESPIMEILR
ncbi:MAG: sodium:proton antiporter [Gammaproteobacteria bacterium RIFCSPHIGHO2_12_FULL_41_15]|nr:MAG: sodium:proton antiporter [Gammaproteobacteria bacterium RIFCSPHIGHO2_12_FULL_41_15]